MTGSTSHEDTPLLFQPIRLRGVTARNRVMVSPMCQYISREGSPVDWHLAHLGRLAIGGAGIVCYEETAVEARGRKTYGCAGLWHDQQVHCFRRVVDLLKGLGASAAIQLGHSGAKAASHDATEGWRPLTQEDARNGFPPWKPVSASAIATGPGRPIAHELSVSEIADLLRAWRDAARRSLEAGFDILEIHGAHGYLIHQFLSPLTNLRTDSYGGGRVGRMRFALEVVETVWSIWPDDKPLFFRVSCVDGPGGIWNLDDTVALGKELRSRGVDVIDCSSGGLSGESDMPVIRRVPGYHVGYSDTVRRECGIMTIASGMVTEGRQAENILRRGQADIVAMARAMLECGDWPFRAAQELGLKDPYRLLPSQYGFRLRRRDEVVQLDIDRFGSQIPSSVSDFIDAN